MRQWLYDNRQFLYPLFSVLLGIALQVARRVVRRRTPEELLELRKESPKFAAFLLFAGSVGIDWERLFDAVQTLVTAVMASRGHPLEPGSPPPPGTSEVATRGDRDVP